MISSLLALAAEKVLTWLARLGLREMGQWELNRKIQRDAESLAAAKTDEERKKALSEVASDSFPPIPPRSK